jgi:2-C-methyl-D-erythritol 4-phosphate cytidylyltransferase/2-C-methyl-D-erythritol 2,4-cyclodiphosphate synthase
VLVHDAARPLATSRLVDAVIAATVEHGAAIPALPVPDTVKQLDDAGGVERTLDRARLRLAQTPQGSRTDWLVAALDDARSAGVEVTDESAALECAGRPVNVVAGDSRNRKITTAEDLETMRQDQGRVPELRVGSGFDIHRIDASRPLVLGGLVFPGEPGLAGHSDADVVLHAVMDALLGAACLGDIGHLFPPEDPAFAGADSTGLATEVAARLQQAGFEVVNLDITLLAERPRIRDRATEMRGAIGDCLGVDTDRIGLKATTLEKLGSLGRSEGIACQAVALIHRVEKSD